MRDDSFDAPQRPDRRPRTEPKKPRKVSERYLENAALHYLKRYSATVSQVRRVLMRRVDRSVRAHGTDKAQAVGWVDALLAKLQRNGLVNDTAYAGMKAQSLRAGGRSSRVIAQKLRLKGVAQDLAATKVAEAAAGISEEEAARIWARKKRLGPYRREPGLRLEKRERDLAALARAGFAFAIARRIIDGAAE